MYVKVPEGMEKYFSSTSVLLLKKTLYGLKQAAMKFWRLLLEIMNKWGMNKAKLTPACTIPEVKMET